MNKDSFLKFIKESMKEAASSTGTTPENLTWHVYQKWVNENKDLKTVVPPGMNFAQTIGQFGGYTALKGFCFKPAIEPAALVIKATAKAAKQDATIEANKTLLLESIESILGSIKPAPAPSKLPERAKYLERTQHLLVSDTHFGSNLTPDCGARQYGAVEEARSFAKIVVETAEHKPQYRKETGLIVNINGDVIQGEIHDPRNYEEVSKQCARAINVLATGIDLLAHQYPQVTINAVSGNHDRYAARHGSERAMQAKDDSHAYVVYYAIKKYFSKYPNVKMNIPGSSVITYNSLGSWYYGTHGDTHIHLPNPSGVVNTKDLENQINKLNARINGPKYNVVFCGHIHTGMLLHLSNGVVLITNPPLIPTDEYGLSLNIDPDSPTGQWLWESVEGHPVGDARFLRVTEADRQDSRLDKIIPVDF